MRFSVAATLLGVSQSIPTWSAVHVHGKRSQSNIRPRTLKSNDIIRAAKENRLSAAQRRLAFHLNHLKALNNGPRILKANVYCDPTSTDPDIGILSCGDSHMCQASLGAAEFGGICVPKRIAKKQRSRGSGFIGMLPKASRHVPIVDDSGAEAKPPVPCDPTTLSDIGILACGQNNVCQVDESSQLGGFCSSTSNTSRRLDTVYFCNETLSGYTCDCNDFDNTTGTGTLECLFYDENYYPFPYSSSAECQAVTLQLALSYTYENSVLTAYTLCYEIRTLSKNLKLCIYSNYGSVPDKPCIPTLNKDQECSSRSYGTCLLTLDGQPCVSCDANLDSSVYDCSNIEGGGADENLFYVLPSMAGCLQYKCTLCAVGDSMAYAHYDINVTIPDIGERSCGYLALAEYLSIPEEVCSVASEAAQKGCCAYQCDLCSPGTYIPAQSDYIRLDLVVPGYEGFTCGDLASAAYVNFSIPKGTCASIAGLIQETCCQARRDECSLCDGPLTNPYANVTIEGNLVQCANLQSFLTAQECRGVISNVYPVCCSKSTLPAPVETPTAAPPVAPSSEEAETPDAATGIVAKGGFLASVGGVVLAAFLVVASC